MKRILAFVAIALVVFVSRIGMASGFLCYQDFSSHEPAGLVGHTSGANQVTIEAGDGYDLCGGAQWNGLIIDAEVTCVATSGTADTVGVATKVRSIQRHMVMRGIDDGSLSLRLDIVDTDPQQSSGSPVLSTAHITFSVSESSYFVSIVGVPGYELDWACFSRAMAFRPETP